MPESFFRVQRVGHVRRVTMDRPDKLNALGPAFWDGLQPVFAAIDADDDARCVVLDGAGRAFTSGLDVMGMVPSLPLDLQGGPPDGARRHALHETIRRMQAAITAVERCRVPVIAAIHGFCLGGGVDLATACDIRWCAADAVFGVRETKLAIVADVGTLQRLPAIVGPAWTRELAFTGRDLDATLAERIGLVTRVLPDKASLDAAVAALALEIAENPPLAVQGCKRVLVEGDRGHTDRGLEYVATWNTAYLATRDLTAAVTAMATRTPPKFEGR
jgi:enoyl-CoA hydratase